MNNMGQLAEDVTAPFKEAASEAVKVAGDVSFVVPAECLAEFGFVDTNFMYTCTHHQTESYEWRCQPVGSIPVFMSSHEVLARSWDISCLQAARCAFSAQTAAC